MAEGATNGDLALSVIIVTWNNTDVIAECLSSLRDSQLPYDTEIVLIDNASTDATADRVARDFPSVRLIRNPTNIGFSAANNLAMKHATGSAILLLNPDVVLIDPTAIAGMLDALAADDGIGMAGCRLVYRDGRHQVGDAGFRPTAFNMISHGLGIGHALLAARPLYLVRPDRHSGTLVDVDWICGACLMVRAESIKTVGDLDERSFLYAEDIEWGCRFRSYGFRCVYLSRVRVVHLQGESEAQANPGKVSTRWLGSLFSLYATLGHGRYLPVVRAAFMIGFGGRALIYLALAMARPRRWTHYHRKSVALLAYARATLTLAATAYPPPREGPGLASVAVVQSTDRRQQHDL